MLAGEPGRGQRLGSAGRGSVVLPRAGHSSPETTAPLRAAVSTGLFLHLLQATSSSTVQSTAQQAEAQRGSATLQLPFPLSWSRKFRAETSNSNALLPSGGSFCSLRLPRNLILQRNPLAPALRQDPRLPEQAKPLSFSSLTPAFWSTRGP
ncbi:unnamed protein product, partial [Rangifer tarandus platyrhynchus]